MIIEKKTVMSLYYVFLQSFDISKQLTYVGFLDKYIYCLKIDCF